jgi:hypothetical protein
MYQLAVVIVIIIVYILVDINDMFVSCDEFLSSVNNTEYFNRITEEDLLQLNTPTIQEYLANYRAAYIPFTWWEKSKIYSVVAYIRMCIPHKLNVCKWRFAKIKLSKSLAFGLPHTINNLIILNSNVIGLPYDELSELLAHEFIHLYQKAQPIESDKLAELLGFFRIDDITENMINKLDMPFITNPDTTGDYFYNDSSNRYIIKTIYSSDANNLFNDIGISLDSSELDTFKIIKVDFATNINQQGHPYEIMAELIARIIVCRGFVRKDWRYIIEKWITRD